MKKSIEKLIPKIQDFFETQPINKAWLFGSCARGENRRNSDVDLLVQYDKDANLSLFRMIEIMNNLEDIIHKPVDLVEDGRLMWFAVKSVNKDKILIYERGNKECWSPRTHVASNQRAAGV